MQVAFEEWWHSVERSEPMPRLTSIKAWGGSFARWNTPVNKGRFLGVPEEKIS